MELDELLKKWYKILYAIGAVLMFYSSDISDVIPASMRGVTLFGVGLLLIAGSVDFKEHYKGTKEKVGFLSNVLFVIGVGLLLVSMVMIVVND